MASVTCVCSFLWTVRPVTAAFIIATAWNAQLSTARTCSPPSPTSPDMSRNFCSDENPASTDLLPTSLWPQSAAVVLLVLIYACLLVGTLTTCRVQLKPNSITLSGSKLVRSRSPTSFEPASVMELAFSRQSTCLLICRNNVTNLLHRSRERLQSILMSMSCLCVCLWVCLSVCLRDEDICGTTGAIFT